MKSSLRIRTYRKCCIIDKVFGLKNKRLRLLFFPLSLLYAVVTLLRNKFYDWHIFRTFKIPDCILISIGNITVGGTGKTPAVEFLANYLIGQGKKVAILSRGYQRESKGTILISDGKNILVNSRNGGDEPYLLARNLSNVPIIVENDRYKGSTYIKKKFNPDFIILDDAFQHRKIYRDLDIVLIDSMTGLDNQFTLPGGVLREPLNGLKRGDMIWLTRVDQTEEVNSLISSIKKYTDVPIVKTIHQPRLLYSLFSNEQISLKLLKNKQVFIFSGIGNHNAFHDTILRLQAIIKGELIFIDHYKYQKADLKRICIDAQHVDAEWIITTEKDAVRIFDISAMKIPIFYLKIELKINEGLKCIKKILNV